MVSLDSRLPPESMGVCSWKVLDRDGETSNILEVQFGNLFGLEVHQKHVMRWLEGWVGFTSEDRVQKWELFSLEEERDGEYVSEVFKKGTMKTNPLLTLTLLLNMRARGQLAKMKPGKCFTMDRLTRVFRSPDPYRLQTSNWYKQQDVAELALILWLCCVLLSKFSLLYVPLCLLCVFCLWRLEIEWRTALNGVLLKQFTQQGFILVGHLFLPHYLI